MTTETLSVPTAPPKPRRAPRTLREWLTRNPVILKELRGRMRGNRAFVLLTFHLMALSGFVGLIYGAYAASANNVYNAVSSQVLGKIVFGAVVGLELLLACFITPALTAGAISGEREKQTFDLLRTTQLSAPALVLGKLGSAMLFVLVLLVTALPLQSLAFLLGGVAPEELLVAAALLVATAFLFGAAGIFFSSLMRRTLGSTVLSYAFALLDTLGLPLVMLAILPVIGIFFSGYGAPDVLAQAVFVYTMGLLIALNPIAAAITTEVLLSDSAFHTLFYFTVPLSGSFKLPLVSPWLPCILFCFGLGAVMLLVSIRIVGHAER
jgi:ABC-type transport system involved in multi-copper enzyme maturation permease subunit